MNLVKQMLASSVVVLLMWSVSSAQQGLPAANSAVVPRLVNFSGKATDGEGKPLSGVNGATFAIYKDQEGGSPFWLESQNIQPDTKGNYTVQLGATKPDGLPLDLFTSGEARWLGVTINGGQEQPRVLLLSVPYALKAADAETVGGLPPSAFVLAAPPVSSSAVSSANSMAASSMSAPPPSTSNVTTTGGVVNALPLWTTATNIQSSALTQSGTGTTAKVGVNNTTPATTLDVNGAETVRGNLSLPAMGTANATSGKNSQPTTITASAFNSGTGKAVSQNFRWQSEPTGNNTSSPAGTLNLLFGSGSSTPTETGLHISSKGQITFASGQTFPGTGSVSSVGLSAPPSDFTVSGSPITNSGTLALSWAVPPTSADTANAIVKRDSSGSFYAGTINSGNIVAAGAITATFGITAPQLTVSNPAGVAVLASTSSANAAITGTSTGTNAVSDGVDGITTSGTASGVAGINNGGGIGVYATGGTGVFGTGSNYGFQTDSNVQQARTAGGWVKAMVWVNALNTPYSIVRCFNSTLAGAAATTPPCGINFTENANGVGFWDFDFGFEVDDRFVSATLMTSWTQVGVVASCIAAIPGLGTVNVVDVQTWDCGTNGKPAQFSLIVF